MRYVTLNNGLQMPQLGFGVFRVPNEEVIPPVEKALEAGYPLLDTARVYNNERGVGEAIKNSGIARDELFITTKLWNKDHGYENALAAYDKSLERLGVEDVDLYLIHWPTPDFDQYIETYKALEKLYKDGRVKSIGVSNFDVGHLERILNECEIVPAINQVECHPYFQQKEMKQFCQEHGITLEAYTPLQNGRDVLQDETILDIASRTGKTPAQVVLRWHLQSGVVVIPKSVTPSRIEENFDVFDFELTNQDMENIAALDRNRREGGVPSEFHRR